VTADEQAAADRLLAIRASLQLTEHGRRMLAAGGWGAAARLAFAVAASEPEERAAETARMIRRCSSIVAVPVAASDDPRTVWLCVRSKTSTDDGATIQIPARHLEGEPTPRELALAIVDLLR